MTRFIVVTHDPPLDDKRVVYKGGYPSVKHLRKELRRRWKNNRQVTKMENIPNGLRIWRGSEYYQEVTQEES